MSIRKKPRYGVEVIASRLVATGSKLSVNRAIKVYVKEFGPMPRSRVIIALATMPDASFDRIIRPPI